MKRFFVNVALWIILIVYAYMASQYGPWYRLAENAIAAASMFYASWKFSRLEENNTLFWAVSVGFVGFGLNNLNEAFLFVYTNSDFLMDRVTLFFPVGEAYSFGNHLRNPGAILLTGMLSGFLLGAWERGKAVWVALRKGGIE